MTDNFLYGVGMNQNGQLTFEEKSSVLYPKKITYFGEKKVILLTAGYENSLFLLEGNELEQFGLDKKNYTEFFKDKPIQDIQAGQDHFSVLTQNGDVYSWRPGTGEYIDSQYVSLEPKKIPFNEPVKHIVCGGHSTYLLLENGDLFGHGSNQQSQISEESTGYIEKPELISHNVLRVFSGPYSHQVFYIDDENKLYCRGYNKYGQLGTNQTSNEKKNYHHKMFDDKEIIDVSCGYCHTLVLTREGEGQHLYSTGYYHYNGLDRSYDTTKFDILFKYSDQHILQMSSGSQFSFLLIPENKFIIFGYNDWGQLGTNDTGSKVKPYTLSFSEFKDKMDLEVICGSYCTFFKQKTAKYHTIHDDLLEFFNKQEFCDAKVKTIDGEEISFHSLIVTLRTQRTVYEIIEILQKKTKKQVNLILTFLYSLKFFNFDVLEMFSQEIDYPDLIGTKKSEIYDQDLEKLYQQDSTKDFVIISEGKEIKAHKIILAARSELFHGMFMTVQDDSGKVHDYRESSSTALQKLIEFLYLDSLQSSISNEIALELEEMIDFYQLNPKSKLSSEILRMSPKKYKNQKKNSKTKKKRFWFF
ncbi:regulator of chromosome condensation [Anaeramoeba ignava]|uniref:Regulator of chromosome condensation n=1 Tax=Anaeramoeba ignava TaxID=1746090 RepID=A0A9Q0RDK1_ANAIG|nr:regulator of chromosome condensation [Anaeramoeba ignava]